jgi:RHS repeat-associated protein
VGSERFWFGSLSVGMRDASGQQYMRNRYYNPQTGQFTQPDPIGLAGGLNSYGFAAGDPVSYSDPYGLWVEFQNAEARALWYDMKARAEAALHSDDPRVRKGGSVLLGYIHAAENDPFSVFRIEVTDIDDLNGGGHEENMAGGYMGAYRVQVDSNPPSETPGSTWIILAHEIGGAVARSQFGFHWWGGVRAENAARRIAGCPIRRFEGGNIFKTTCRAP